ncbi:MAG: VCBS repeat-containing protein, partial [Porticoccaceae bacterium]|nr:VCBS repeat-containing protein [Porticoccaceae bacterium]
MYQLSQFGLPNTALPTNLLSSKSISQRSKFLCSLVCILFAFISHSSGSWEFDEKALTIAAGDLNKDGKQDIVAIDENNALVVWEREDSDHNGSADWEYTILWRPSDGLPSKPKIWLVDLDQDSILDIVISNANREDSTVGVQILHTLLDENNVISVEDYQNFGPSFNYIDTILHHEATPPTIIKFVHISGELRVSGARLAAGEPAEDRRYMREFEDVDVGSMWFQYECDDPCLSEPGITLSDYSDSNEIMAFIGQKAYSFSTSIPGVFSVSSINSNAIVDSDPVLINGHPVSWGGTIHKPLASATGQLGYSESYDTITKDHVVCGLKACTVFYKSVDDNWISSSIVVASELQVHYFKKMLDIAEDQVHVDIKIADIDGDGDEDIVIASNGPLSGTWKNERNGIFKQAIEDNKNSENSQIVPLFMPSRETSPPSFPRFIPEHWIFRGNMHVEIADLTGNGRSDIVWLSDVNFIDPSIQDTVPDFLNNRLLIHGDAIEKQEMSVDFTHIELNSEDPRFVWEQIECEKRPKRIEGVVSSDKYIRLCNPKPIMTSADGANFTPTPESRPINSPGNIRAVIHDNLSVVKESKFSSPRSYSLTTYEKWWDTASGVSMPLGTLVAVVGGSYMLSRTLYPLFAPVPIAYPVQIQDAELVPYYQLIPSAFTDIAYYLSDSDVPTANCAAVVADRRLAETSVSEAAPCVRTEWFRLPAHLTCQNYNDPNHQLVCGNGLVPYWRLGTETDDHRNTRLAEEVHLASTPTYAPTAADIGSVIYTKATVVHEDGSEETYMGRPINIVDVNYLGDMVPNGVIKADLAGIYHATLNYQWQWKGENNDEWQDIPGETSHSYRLLPADVADKDLRVKIEGTDINDLPFMLFGPDISKFSYAGKPKITGNPRVGHTLTAKWGNMEDEVTEYRWFSKGPHFMGTGKTYKVKLHDLGKEFFVWAFYKDGSETKGAISNLEGPVTRPANQTGSVRYNGKIKKGKVIRAVVSDGNGLNGVNISYQWQWTNNKTNG